MPPAMPNCCCIPMVREDPSSLPTLENLPCWPVKDFDSPAMNELSTSGLILIVACFSALSIAEKKLEKLGVATSVLICGTFRLPIVRSRFCSSFLMLEKSAVPVRAKAGICNHSSKFGRWSKSVLSACGFDFVWLGCYLFLRREQF